MNKNLFSVIIPIYNVELYLKQCIDSVINQTYRNIEIILVDDGSTDNCSVICDEYARHDDRIKVIHKKNGGLVSARKAGANIAVGDYITCVDGDDWVDENYIAKFAEIIDKYNPDIVVCGFIKSDEKINQNRVLPYRKGYYTKKSIVSEIFPILMQNKNAKYFAPNIWGKAYKAKLYVKSQNAVDNNIKIGEDGACVIPCVYNAESMFISEDCTYYYRQNPTSMTKERKAFDINGPKLIAKHLENNIDIGKYDFQSQLYLKISHELFNVLVSQFNRNENYNTIKNDIKRCLEDDIYKEAIQKSHFKGVKGRVASFIMRFNCYRIMQLINYIRRHK